MSFANLSNPGLGDLGELWFASQLPLNWVWQPPRRDVGKDGLVVIQDKSELQNLEFSVQIKTTTKPRIDGESIRVSGVSTTSVLYWFSSPQPTLVVVVDNQTKRGWFSWHLDLFTSPTEISGKKTCSITVPLVNLLNADGWLSIGQRLRRHYGGLQNALHTARMASKIVPSIRTIASAARDLLWLNREPNRPRREDFSPEDHDAVFLLIHDQCCYRGILDSVRKCQSLFSVDGYTYKQLSVWLVAFEAHASEAYPTFHTFREAANYAGVQVVFNAPMLKPKREILLSATLDVIALLSGGSSDSAV